MFEQILYHTAYVLALSLQLSAGLLLVGNTNITRKGIINEYCARHTAIAFDKSGKLVDSNDLREVVKSTWTNYFAFIYLFAGYLVSVFGEPLSDKFLFLIIIVVLTAIISIVTLKVAKSKGNRFETIHKDELPLEKGVSFVMVD